MKIKDFFLLSWKKVLMLVVTTPALIFLWFISAIEMKEILEFFFFIVVVFIIPTYTLIAILFTLINFIKKRKKGSK